MFEIAFIASFESFEAIMRSFPLVKGESVYLDTTVLLFVGRIIRIECFSMDRVELFEEMLALWPEHVYHFKDLYPLKFYGLDTEPVPVMSL